MPGFFHQPIDRRDFLKASGKVIAAGALATHFAPSAVGADASSERLHLALLSDTHVAADPKTENRKFLPTENLRLAVSQVLEAGPRAAVIDGDIARLSGQLEDYQAIKGLLAPLAEKCPIYMTMGNHDNRENFLKTFPPPAEIAQRVSGKNVLVYDQPFLRVILLDSLLYVNQVAGLLGRAQRAWLDQFLARSDGRATVLFVHHTLQDGDGDLLDVDALFRIVRPYRKVKAIFYGHSHEYSVRRQESLHLVNLPAVGYNFSDKEPVGWVDAFFSPEGVEFTLRAIGGNKEKDGKSVSLAWT